MTATEEKLWNELKENKLNNFRFRRQHPIALYIADFYCHKQKLVIEIDGEVHNNSESREYDFNRDKTMNEFGIKVLRFTNEDINIRLSEILNIIVGHLQNKN